MLEEEINTQKYNDYVAITQSCIGQLLCSYMGGDWGLPNYYEFMYPEAKKEDKRSGEEIRSDLVRRLLE